MGNSLICQFHLHSIPLYEQRSYRWGGTNEHTHPHHFPKKIVASNIQQWHFKASSSKYSLDLGSAPWPLALLFVEPKSKLKTRAWTNLKYVKWDTIKELEKKTEHGFIFQCNECVS